MLVVDGYSGYIVVDEVSTRRRAACQVHLQSTCDRRVLLIEDDSDQAEAFSAVLQGLIGCAVEVAQTGVEGVEKARRSHPDVIFCDIRLPDIEGFEVARRIRAVPDLQSTHLVALGAHVLPEHRKRSEEAGFEEHLAKPPAVDEIERCIFDREPRTP